MNIRVLNEEFSPYIAEDVEMLTDEEIVQDFLDFMDGDSWIEPYWKGKDGLNDTFYISQYVYTKDLNVAYEDN